MVLKIKTLKVVIFLSLCCSLLIFAGCSTNSSQPIEIHVLTAASMTNAMDELKAMYEKENKDVQIIPNYGSSGQLKTQIDQGAPADVFLSAAVRWMDELDEAQLITERHDLLRNDLVLITHKDKQLSIESLVDLRSDQVHNISIGLPETVPAGEYAQQALENLALYADLEAKMIFASDVRQVLTYVQTGNVDAGLVYRTDAILVEDVTIMADVDPTLHDDIIYPSGLLSASAVMEEAKEFYRWLRTEEAITIFEKYGFTGMVED